MWQSLITLSPTPWRGLPPLIDTDIEFTVFFVLFFFRSVSTFWKPTLVCLFVRPPARKIKTKCNNRRNHSRITSDPSYDICSKRGRCLLSYRDYEFKETDKYKYKNYLCFLVTQETLFSDVCWNYKSRFDSFLQEMYWQRGWPLLINTDIKCKVNTLIQAGFFCKKCF